MLAADRNVFSIRTVSGIRLASARNARILAQDLVDSMHCVMCTTTWPAALVRSKCKEMHL